MSKQKEKNSEKAAAKAIRMFTSNKKREASGRCISFYACRVFITFYSLNCPQITLRFILGSCCVFRNHFQIPPFRFMQEHYIFHGGTHTHTQTRRKKSSETLSLFIARFLIVKCAFSHAIQHTFMAKTQICRCFIAFYFVFFYRKEFSCTLGMVQMICCHTV